MTQQYLPQARVLLMMKSLNFLVQKIQKVFGCAILFYTYDNTFIQHITILFVEFLLQICKNMGWEASGRVQWPWTAHEASCDTVTGPVQPIPPTHLLQLCHLKILSQSHLSMLVYCYILNQCIFDIKELEVCVVMNVLDIVEFLFKLIAVYIICSLYVVINNVWSVNNIMDVTGVTTTGKCRWVTKDDSAY